MSEELIVEQLGRFQERVEARFDQVEAMLRYHLELDEERLRALRDAIVDLRGDVADHEQRIRGVTDAAIQFKVLAGLATGGGLLAVIALVKAILGQ